MDEEGKGEAKGGAGEGRRGVAPVSRARLARRVSAPTVLNLAGRDGRRGGGAAAASSAAAALMFTYTFHSNTKYSTLRCVNTYYFTINQTFRTMSDICKFGCTFLV